MTGFAFQLRYTLCRNLNPSPTASLQMYLIHPGLIKQKYGCQQAPGLLFHLHSSKREQFHRGRQFTFNSYKSANLAPVCKVQVRKHILLPSVTQAVLYLCYLDSSSTEKLRFRRSRRSADCLLPFCCSPSIKYTEPQQKYPLSPQGKTLILHFCCRAWKEEMWRQVPNWKNTEFIEFGLKF